jgi:hypothetical protein
MPIFGLYSIRSQAGVGRLMYKVDKLLIADEKKFAYEEKGVKGNIDKLNAPAVFSQLSEILHLSQEEGEHLYEVGHDADIEIYRCLQQIHTIVTNSEAELNLIREILGLAKVKDEVERFRTDEERLKGQESDMHAFLMKRRKMWNMEMQERGNMLMGFSAYSSERMTRQLKLATRKMIGDFFARDEYEKYINEHLPKLRKEFSDIMAKRDTIQQGKLIETFRDELVNLEKKYTQLVEAAKKEQEQMEEIYKIDFILMYRLHERLTKFKENVLNKLSDSGFFKLTAEDLGEIKLSLPKEIQDALDRKIPLQAIIVGYYTKTEEILHSLESKLAREEFVASKAAVNF